MENNKTTRRIVVKIGSQVLCDEQGNLNLPVVSSLAEQISTLVEKGWQPLLVSSGAVASGTGVMQTEPGARKLAGIANPVTRKQAFAAAGQVRLMESWRRFFDAHGLSVAQVLATRGDFQTRRHYLNMRACIEALMDAGLIPIVNENDVVAVTELMFTDNDELGGLMAGMVNAEMLCILSTVPGVYDGDPDQPDSSCINEWDDNLHQVDDIVQRGTSLLGRGGMHSKIAMARKAANLGTRVVIADGCEQDVLMGIVGGADVGTCFPARAGVSPAKRWLASAQYTSTGSVTVNEGAAAALINKNQLASLLPVGIEAVQGPFERGDVVQIQNPDGSVLGCGRARYNDKEAEKLKGQKGQKPLIHHDYLYIAE